MLHTLQIPTMMPQTRLQSLPFFSFFLFSLFSRSICLKHEPKTKGIFVFGSSVVDNGNNNFLVNSTVKADYFPYGVDFPLGASGRFTNGKSVIDVLGEKLRLPLIPPFGDPSTNGSRIVRGVDFASGGSGILDNTGVVTGNVTSLNQQIRNFETVTLPELELQLGGKSREKLSEYLFVVGSGGNDYSLNYFLGLTSGNVSLEEFTANLTTTLSRQLKRLYSLGARKFVLLALYPNGCSPLARTRDPTQEGCVESLNRAADMFNTNLMDLVVVIKPQMPGSNLVFVNAYKIIRDIIRFPRLRGFSNVINACCEVTPVSQGGTGYLCKRGGSVCKNRNEYLYFDGLHLTEAVNVVLGTKAFESNLRAEVSPFNVRQLSVL